VSAVPEKARALSLAGGRGGRMTTGVRSTRRGGSFNHVVVIAPHNTNELPNYAEAVVASADCTADIVTTGGDAVTAFAFTKGINWVSVSIVKNNVSSSATLWALY
jgi:hypothetical protein